MTSIHNFRKYHTRIPKTDKVEPMNLFYEVENEYFRTKAELYDWLNCNPDYAGDILVHKVGKLINV